MKSKVALFLLIVAVSAGLLFYIRQKKNSQDNQIDPRLVAAKKQAQEQIQTFIDAVQKRDCVLIYRCSIERKFEENGIIEYLNVDILSYKNGLLYGELDTTPKILKKIHRFDDVVSKVGDVEDWFINQYNKGVIAGAFSYKATGQEDRLKDWIQSDVGLDATEQLFRKEEAKGIDFTKPLKWKYYFLSKDKAKLVAFALDIPNTYQIEGIKTLEGTDDYVLIASEQTVHTLETFFTSDTNLTILALENGLNGVDRWGVEKIE